jgi:GDP/UDP-N,N'-diacetylbacillosamine 2-epimerase (hydrolysing)
MPGLTLQVIATGMHLSPHFGLTHREIESDGFAIDRRVDIELEGDSPVAIARSMSLGLSGVGEALAALAPDIMLVLGDRFEILAGAAAALVARIPVAHIHGGEVSEGAIDEAMRHAITKMAHLHFVAAEPYRQRVIQLGEDPDRVFLVGGLGVDNIHRDVLLDRAALEADLEFQLGHRNLLVTFHPITTSVPGESARQLRALLSALATLSDMHIILTRPNADAEGRELSALLDEFAAAHPHARVFASLGRLRYLSCLKHVDAVVGNSSSGLTEAPSFRIGTIDIGDRQGGRLRAESVISAAPDRESILAALARVYSPEFRAVLARTRNPYGGGGASVKIVEVLASVSLDGIVKKRFHDLPGSGPS